MMHGQNELKLCPAEMHAALQYYLENVVFKDGAPKVTGFSYDATSSMTTIKLTGAIPEALAASKAED